MDDWTVRRVPRRWLLVVLLGAVAGLVAGRLLGGIPGTDRAGRAPAPLRATAQTGARDPIAVLSAWDGERASAWAAGDRDRLRGLYQPGSRAGAADLRLLDRYLARGLVVVGMRRQVLAARVLSRSSGALRVRVTDRLIGAWAVTRDDPRRRVRLPQSQPRRRVIALRRTDATWRVVSVSAVRR